MQPVIVNLDKFQPRPYQIPMMDAILNKGYRRVMAILPRRAGKDITAFNICIRMLLRKIQTIFYVFPTYSGGRKILWDAITIDGTRVLDFIPEELIESRNEQQMRIRLKNGSVFQIIGSDSYDTSLVGTNPGGIVFSEFALADPRAYQYSRPILAANDGWALFISTPRGKNHLWDLWNIGSHNPDTWFVYKMTVEETGHIPLASIEEDRRTGEMSEDLIQQEYYCSFEMGVEGSYYAKYIDNLRLKSQIGVVMWEPAFKVHTAWDIGVRDSTSIIFFQTIGQTIRVIDYYEKSKEGLEHYTKVLQSKPYSYGKHIAPHDIGVQEWGSGQTRIEKAKNLGINFTLSGNVSISDGIESVRSALPKMWIDEKMCAQLIKALENYRQEFDAKRKVYNPRPLHDQWSHAADAMRYLCVSLPKTRDGLSPEDLDRQYREARYGSDQGNMPSVFRSDLPKY